MHVFKTLFTLSSRERTEVVDITEPVKAAVGQFPMSRGIALVNTLHTTCALFVNEFQNALISDLRELFDVVVPERNSYRHNDPRVSDCERGNAHSHLRVALLGRSITVGVNRADLVLGRFQSIVFAEFDGPRKREITIHVIGE